MPNIIKTSNTKTRLKFYKDNGDIFYKSFKTIYLNNTPFYKITDTINYNYFSTYKSDNYVDYIHASSAINY